MADRTIKSYQLQHPGGCSGMFWRKNPFKSEAQNGNADWPRNGSILKGYPHFDKEALGSSPSWLEVTEWKQAGSTKWVKGCSGIWMPFHQGGLLLFETKLEE